MTVGVMEGAHYPTPFNLNERGGKLKARLKSIMDKAGINIPERLSLLAPEPKRINFLHIGKNAGTYISNLADQINAVSAKRKIVKCSHNTHLAKLPHAEDYFFSIRNPISRFKSGFYSRKRKGQPRIYSEWTKYDTLAFSEFEHANDLAESLFQPGDAGHKAWAAMKSIRHTAQNQADWFVCCGNFLRVRPPIWIIRQENLSCDLGKFLEVADLGVDLSALDLGVDDITSHKNDYTDAPPLSQKAEENLRAWYAQDLEFYKMCERWIENNGSL